MLRLSAAVLCLTVLIVTCNAISRLDAVRHLSAGSTSTSTSMSTAVALTTDESTDTAAVTEIAGGLESSVTDASALAVATSDTTSGSYQYLPSSALRYSNSERCCGRWRVYSRMVMQTSNAGSCGHPTNHKGVIAYFSNGLSWQDYFAKGTIQSWDNDGIGILFRYRDPNNYYSITWGGGDCDGYLRLQVKSGGSKRILWSRRMWYRRGQSYEWEIHTFGAELTFKLNRNTLFTVRDSTIPSGTIGFYSLVNANGRWGYWRYQLDHRRAAIARLAKTVGVLASATGKLGSAVSKKRSEVNSARSAAERASAQAKSETAATASMNGDITKLSAQYKELRSQLDVAEKAARELKARVDASVAGIKSEAKTLRAEVDSMSKRAASLPDKVVQTAQLVVSRRGEAGKLSEQYVKVLQEIKTSKTDLDSFQAHLASRKSILGRQLQAATDIHTVASAQVEKLQDQVRDAETKVAEIERQKAKYLAETEVAERQMEESKTTLSQLYSDAESQRGELTSKRKQFSTEAHDHHVTLENLENNVSDLREKTGLLAGQADRADQAWTQAKAQLDALEATAEHQTSKMKEDIAAKQSDLNHVEQQEAVVRHVASDTTEELTERKAKLAKIVDQVNDAAESRTLTTKSVEGLEEQRTHMVNLVHGLQRVAHGLVEDVQDEASAKAKLAQEVKRKERVLHTLHHSIVDAPKQHVIHRIVTGGTPGGGVGGVAGAGTGAGAASASGSSSAHPVYQQMEDIQRSIGDASQQADVLKEAEAKRLEAAARLQLAGGNNPNMFAGGAAATTTTPTPPPAAGAGGSAGAAPSGPGQHLVTTVQVVPASLASTTGNVLPTSTDLIEPPKADAAPPALAPIPATRS